MTPNVEPLKPGDLWRAQSGNVFTVDEIKGSAVRMSRGKWPKVRISVNVDMVAGTRREFGSKTIFGLPLPQPV